MSHSSTHHSAAPLHPTTPVEALSQPKLRQRLSTRIVLATLAALVVVMSLIGWTLWLSWQLEGAGVAINDTGSLRMRAHRIGVALLQARAGEECCRADLQTQQTILQQLKQGVPSRPLFLPNTPSIQTQFQKVYHSWEQALTPALHKALAGKGKAAFLTALPQFVSEADHLVLMIEDDNVHKISLLRVSQFILLLIACVGTLSMFYLLYLWIIAPVMRLQEGLQSVTNREFSIRLPIDSKDEFGVLSLGFNRMAGELQELYQNLETRVAHKTELLAHQNRELKSLYDVTAFLNQPSDVDTLCQGFIRALHALIHFDGVIVRTLDAKSEQFHTVAAEGVSAPLQNHPFCRQADHCWCSQSALSTHQFTRHSAFALSHAIGAPAQLPCLHEGFEAVFVFPIQVQNRTIGSFTLLYRTAFQLSTSEIRLLETLGQHLGVALENRWLSAQTRLLAVTQERNLIAQGLHDSIAQNLNFLNLQVQMLERTPQMSSASKNTIEQLRLGIQESYQDIRELLANFRSQLEPGDLQHSIAETMARFERQAQIPSTLTLDDSHTHPLSSDQQLQVLFILQEALSNIRKHAKASAVSVVIRKQADFAMTITDNGVGFDAALMRDEQHIGLRIMQERAHRIKAQLTIESQAQQGTRVYLWVLL